MGYEVAHGESQGFAQQIGWAHNKADLKPTRTLALPSDAVPKKGTPPKVRFSHLVKNVSNLNLYVYNFKMPNKQNLI